LTAIAFVYLWSPNAGLVNRVVRDVLGLPALTFNIHSMAGLVLVTVLHTFPFVYLLAASALESVDAAMEESARILGARPWRIARAITAPRGAPAVPGGATPGLPHGPAALCRPAPPPPPPGAIPPTAPMSPRFAPSPPDRSPL